MLDNILLHQLMRGKPKFKTFANTPQSNPKSPFPSSLQSFSPRQQPPLQNGQERFFSSNSPQTNQNRSCYNLDELKKEMEKAMKHKKKQAREEEERERRYPTQISLMKSDISIASTMFNQDLPMELLSLELNLTENILGLREEKITLMEEYNKQIGERYRVERQISKLQKLTDRQSQQINEQLGQSAKYSNKMEIDPVLLKNEFLKRQYQQLQQQEEQFTKNSQNNEHFINQIQNLASKSRLLELQIGRLEEQQKKVDENRFQTFFPTEKNKKNISLLRQLDQLKITKKQLLERRVHGLHNSAKKTLKSLIQEKNDLEWKCDEMLRKSRTKDSVYELRRKIEREERAKEQFLKDLKEHKQEMDRLKRENQRLRWRE